MTSVLTAKFPSIMRSAFSHNFIPQLTSQRLIHLSSVDLRARRGTREKQKKKKVKVEVQKIDFYTALAMAKNKGMSQIAEKPVDDSDLPFSCDDVYKIETHKTKVYSLEDAIQSLKENNDPTIYNLPNAFVKARIELNMQALKKTRTLENFARLALIDHGFLDVEDRKILVFCKDQELQNAAIKAGASLAGGVELLKSAQKGDLKLNDYRYVLAHTEILMDIVPLRGLLRKKFPSIAAGSVSSDVLGMISKFINGIEYKAVKHKFEQQFGLIECHFGRLSMPTEHLIDNFVALLKDVDSVRPKRDGLFITRCFLQCEPSKEVFKIDPFVYIESGLTDTLPDPEPEEEEEPKAAKDDDSDDEDKEKVKVKVAKKG